MRSVTHSVLVVIGFIMICIATPDRLIFAQKDRSIIHVTASSGLDYTIAVILTDSQGRRAGLLSVPANIGPEPIPGSITEIPNSSNGYDAIDDHVTGERSPGAFKIAISPSPLPGSYTLVVAGTVLTTYWVDIDTLNREANRNTFTFKGVTDKNLKATYQLNYSPEPGTPTTAVRVSTFLSAKQDMDLAFRADWIKNAGLKNSLAQKLSNAEAAQGRGDVTAASNILSAFLNEVKAQSGKGIDPDAETMLTQDAQYLIEHL